MPRRLINSDIWFNERVASRPYLGRLFFIGIFNNADDEGRLKAKIEYLKAIIFPYEHIAFEELENELQELDKLKLIRLYNQNGNRFIFLPGWGREQQIKKDRFKPSELPLPPPECLHDVSVNGDKMYPDVLPNVPISQVKSSQVKSSQVKLNEGKISQRNFSFADVLNDEKGLTDRLTTTLKEYLPRGWPQVMHWVVRPLLEQAGIEVTAKLFDVIYAGLQKYDEKIIVEVLVKAARYAKGKKSPANYIMRIIEEKEERQEINAKL